MGHPEFAAFIDGMNAATSTPGGRRDTPTPQGASTRTAIPRQLIDDARRGPARPLHDRQPLLDAYDVYQHLMDYWAETMQDDAYLIAADGWKAETYRVIEEKTRRGSRRTRAGPATWSQAADRRPLLREGAGRHRRQRRPSWKRATASSPSWRKSTAAKKALSVRWRRSPRPRSTRA